MSDYREVCLGDVADLNWGDTKTTKASYIPHGFRAFSASGPDGWLPWADYDRIGVVVSAIGADCGKTWLAKGKWSCIKNTIRFFSSDPNVDTEYLYWATRDPGMWPRRGSAQPFISQGDARNIRLIVPSFAEQRAIAGVLGALDDKIESNRRIWRTSLELISVARLHMNLNEFTSVKSLGEIIDFNINTKKPGSNSDLIVYIDIASVSPGSVDKQQLLDWGSAPSRARRGVIDGDVIFSTVRPARRSFAVMLSPDSRTVVSTGFAVMTPRECGTSFLLSVVSDTNFADYCETVAQGSAYPAVSPDSMSRFEVEVPSGEVLAKFESSYLPILRRGHQAQSESLILSDLRDSLLTELLSGRIRVRDAEIVVEGAV